MKSFAKRGRTAYAAAQTVTLTATLIAAILSASAFAATSTTNAAPPEGLIDGPYIFHAEKSGDSAKAIWICNGEKKALDLRPHAKLNAPCGSVSGFALNTRNDVAPDKLPQPARWAAVSDIHGQVSLFLQLLRTHKIIDAKDQWNFGKNVLVITGDVFDRGPQQTEALWTIYRLTQEAGAAGGSVQMLLGNHETMVLRGDLRYLHPKYPQVAALLGRPFKELYGKDSELGQWLRTRASILKLGDTLFLHGGLHPDIAQQTTDFVALNAKVRTRLGDSRDALRDDAEATWLFGTHGPFWYRGYFVAPRASSDAVDAQLKQYAVKRIVVGHTTRGEITSLYGGRVIGIDAEMKEGVRGELLLWENDQLQRGLLDGTRRPLPPGDDDGSGKLKSFKND